MLDNRRGLSDVVYNVLMITLFVVSIAIMGVIVLNLVKISGESIDIASACKQINVKPVGCVHNVSDANFLFATEYEPGVVLNEVDTVAVFSDGTTANQTILGSVLGNFETQSVRESRGNDNYDEFYTITKFTDKKGIDRTCVSDKVGCTLYNPTGSSSSDGIIGNGERNTTSGAVSLGDATRSGGGGSGGSGTTTLTLVNGACGTSQNTCTSGNLNDIADNATTYLWQCTGANGGSTGSCSLSISPAQAGNALEFNQLNSLVTPSINLNNLADLTVSFWLKINDTQLTNGSVRIIDQSWSSGAFTIYLVNVSNNVKIGSQLQLDGYNLMTLNNAGNLTKDRWYYVTLAANSYLASGVRYGKATLYLDDVMISTKAAAANPFALNLNLNQPLYVGGSFTGINNLSNFRGLIDEVKIYNRTLSTSEIRQRYNNGLGVKGFAGEYGLIAAWNFDEISGTSISSYAGNYNVTGYNSVKRNSGIIPVMTPLAPYAPSGLSSTPYLLHGVGGSATLTWEDNSNNDQSFIFDYLSDSTPSENTLNWRVYNTSGNASYNGPRSMFITIPEDLPYGNGQIRVRAHNSFGDSSSTLTEVCAEECLTH